MSEERRVMQIPGRGLQCCNCGCVLPTVYRTVTTPGFITRERICPQCNMINTTGERVLNTRERKGNMSDTCE